MASANVASMQQLTFNDKLVKSFSTDALLKKLKLLHAELSEMDQERVDVKSLSAIRKDLIHSSLLLNKDKGVRAFVACCLADLLRLYAPDAPYTANELHDIFHFFLRQLTAGLKGADTAYYAQSFYLLESLASIKSVVLVCDIPQAEELMTEIFRDFFDLARQGIAKNVESFLADILASLVDEAQSLPNELLDVILSQFMYKPPSLHPAHNVATEVCARSADRLQRNICQYFTDIILSHDDNDELDRLRTAHELIKSIGRSCPSLLLNVVPQLEEELKVDRLAMRALATQALGEMFGDQITGLELARKYQTTWHAWLQRRNDKAASVRLAFVETTAGSITHHAELRSEIEDALRNKLLDPDEKVRAASCRVYGQLDYETALHHVSKSQLLEIASRCMDKRGIVRTEAFNCLGRLFKLALSEIESGDPLATQQFSWIPGHVLGTVSVSLDVRLEAERAIYKYILPLPTKIGDESSWTERLLVVARDLDENGFRALLVISNLKTSRPSASRRYLDYCARNNGGVIDEEEEDVTRELARAIQVLSGGFSDHAKASEDLRRFSKMNDSRLYKLLRLCMDSHSDLKTLVKSQTEFLRRAEQSDPTVLDTMSIFLRRSSLWLCNQSSIPTLFQYLHKDRTSDAGIRRMSERAQSLLDYAAKHCPGIYEPHTVEIAKALGSLQRPDLLAVSLRALAAVVRDDPTLAPTDKTIDQLTSVVLSSNPRASKFASRVLAFSMSRTDLCASLIEKMVMALAQAKDDLLLAHLTALAQFTLILPGVFEERSANAITFLVQNIIMRPSTPHVDASTGSDWQEVDQLDAFTRAKLLSIKICRNRCLAHSNAPTAHDMSSPVMKMLWTLLENGSATSAGSDNDPQAKARLRLQAGTAFLKLCSVDVYCKAVLPTLCSLAIIVQDPSFHVRLAFLNKLINLLITRKLDARFSAILFLTALDPEREIRDKAGWYVSHFVRGSSLEARPSNYESVFVRFMHLLAHHPDFSVDGEGLTDMSKYVTFFIDLMATSENVPLLFHLALKMKTVRDSESQHFSENLYVISELAQQVIKAHASSQAWALPSFPGKIRLPDDIFKPHSSAADLRRVMKTVYLPETSTPLETAKPFTKINKLSKKKEGTAGRIAVRRIKRKRHIDNDSDSSASDDTSDAELRADHKPIRSRQSRKIDVS